ncbi:MAG: methyltransferase domain-containing protein [Saprospiraceae bacterium]
MPSSHKNYTILLLMLVFFSCNDKQTTTDHGNPTIIHEDIIEEDIDGNYNNIGRAIWQKPGLVIDKLGDLSDKVVVDLGAGTGYFSLRLAMLSKKVIAIEIEPGLIKYIDSTKAKLPKDKREILETRLAKQDNPYLKDGEADIILIINTIAYIDNLPSYLKVLKKGLSAHGTLMIIDYKMKKLPIHAPPKTERIYLDKLEDLLAEAGYNEIQTDDTSLDYQYIIQAKKD